MTHKEYADGLRALADFFEAHEELVLPSQAGEFDYFGASTKEKMGVLAKALGHSKKEVDDKFFKLIGKVGNVQFTAFAFRENVCVRRKVGSIPIPATPEVVIPAKPAGEQPVYKWHCPDSLFDGGTDESATP